MIDGFDTMLKRLFTQMDEKEAEQPSDALCIFILDVGKADAILCQCGKYVLVIDAGMKQDGKKVLHFLEQRKLTQVDCLIITHYDKDHVGGAIELVKSMPVKRVILPDYEPSHPDAVEFLDGLKEKGISPEKLRKTVEFPVSDMKVLVEPPGSYDIKGDKDYDNDFSLVTTIVCGKRRLVFAADMEKRRINDWLASEPPACDFLKYPHHGVFEKEQRTLMKVLQPDHVVICDSKKSPADKAALKLIEKYTDSFYETKDGTVTVFCDSRGITLKQDRKG